MPVEINTTQSRLTPFEDHVLAELMRLQCREAELVATVQERDRQIEALEAQLSERPVDPRSDQIIMPAPFRGEPIRLPD